MHVNWAGKNDKGDAKHESKSEVPATFGDVGAVLVENEHPTELFIRTIILNGSHTGPLTITCNSWSYLPSQTPSGLRKLREKELENLRGDGKGERKAFERIYDYDKYNDLGDPDINEELARPILGGEEHPYPRRCRTSRAPSNKDPLSEKRSLSIYVPRDEEFSDAKTLTFYSETINVGLDALLTQIRATLTDPNLGFPSFLAVDSLFTQGMKLPQAQNQ
ncbi:linoleate 13S-lipoxygenase 2-1, chloroplastic-like [Macadamia integrifolia]|uniref:linoleate 13S-lipoxygenase 2-1, chloroplastic-like n=1 Tax=Macadamia integrifolia TaxID=60698 RepID=UPI001C4F0B25|nr:linoleate 13S-lipoxygenase 2-1, chloroplastic-like [Macadamia integrifolia]